VTEQEVYPLPLIADLFAQLAGGKLFELNHVAVFQDDLIVTGLDKDEHLNNLPDVFNLLRSAGLRLNVHKCVFFQPSVEYLGHRISEVGIFPVQSKVDQIKRILAPTGVPSLRSFLGLVQYYGSFIPNLSSLLHPLHCLLKKDQPWTWSSQHQEAFEDEDRKALQNDRSFDGI
jgi:hypothetical protein